MRCCWWCDRHYAATQPEQRFCRRKCAEKARVARRRHDLDLLAARIAAGQPLCPHPLKVGYTTLELAGAAAARVNVSHGHDTQAPYRCLCGTFHLGHSREGAERALIRRLARLVRAA